MRLHIFFRIVFAVTGILIALGIYVTFMAWAIVKVGRVDQQKPSNSFLLAVAAENSPGYESIHIINIFTPVGCA